MTFSTTRMDFINMISEQYEDNPNYENVNISMAIDGIDVEYDLKQVPEPDPVIVAQLKEVLKDCTITEVPDLTSRHQKLFYPFPEVESGRLKALLFSQFSNTTKLNA